MFAYTNKEEVKDRLIKAGCVLVGKSGSYFVIDLKGKDFEFSDLEYVVKKGATLTF